jgi:hypothetical protein
VEEPFASLCLLLLLEHPLCSGFGEGKREVGEENSSVYNKDVAYEKGGAIFLGGWGALVSGGTLRRRGLQEYWTWGRAQWGWSQGPWLRRHRL